MSAKNILSAAEEALKIQPSLKKVIIMKLIPRYDPKTVDPLALKSALSLLFNNTLTELWMTSKERDRITIGEHDLDCAGAIREARYKETKTKKFDGINLFGPSGRKVYTISVSSVLKSANLVSADFKPSVRRQQQNIQKRSYREVVVPTEYGNRQSDKGRPSITLSNRFEPLANFQGNF